MSDDILDSVLDLEEASYQAGFDEGKADGAEAGSAKGIAMGIEKGYQKALEMGELHGRAKMLNACLTDPVPRPGKAEGQTAVAPSVASTHDPEREDDETAPTLPHLPTLPANARLKKHVETLLKLSDPRTLATDNSDEAVAQFDDRMKKAVAKAKVIDKLIAEPYNMTVSSGLVGDITFQQTAAAGSGNIEELSNVTVRR